MVSPTFFTAVHSKIISFFLSGDLVVSDISKSPLSALELRDFFGHLVYDVVHVANDFRNLVDGRS